MIYLGNTQGLLQQLIAAVDALYVTPPPQAGNFLINGGGSDRDVALALLPLLSATNLGRVIRANAAELIGQYPTP